MLSIVWVSFPHFTFLPLYTFFIHSTNQDMSAKTSSKCLTFFLKYIFYHTPAPLVFLNLPEYLILSKNISLFFLKILKYIVSDLNLDSRPLKYRTTKLHVDLVLCLWPSLQSHSIFLKHRFRTQMDSTYPKLNSLSFFSDLLHFCCAVFKHWRWPNELNKLGHSKRKKPDFHLWLEI